MASDKRTLPQSNTTGLAAAAPDEGHGLPPKPSSGQKRTRTTSTSESTPALSISPQQLPPRPRRSWTRRSASWTKEEDEKLVQLVKKETAVPPSITASKTWSRVAAQLKNRTGKQCRERYLNQLRPGIRRDPWSPEEERILHEVHARIGNKWVAIAEQLPGRTDNCVKNHWNSMLRKRQRREAAIHSAQKDVSAAASKPDELVQPQTPTTTPSVASLSPTSPGVPSALSSPLFGMEIDRNSDADFSSRTGCATPSGLSSVLDVGSTSGVPSPFTASSPITPKRDVKLQISSLVAQSSDACNHGEGYFTKDELTCDLRMSASLENGDSRQGNRDDTLPNISGGARTCESKPLGDLPVPSGTGETHALQVLPPLHTGETAKTVDSRPLRRSSRLTPGVEKVDAPEINAANAENVKPRRTGVQKMRRLSEGLGNPLAALAIAASSVPPSPLTPDSRFSATSRPHSSSPSNRAKQVTSKRAKRLASSFTNTEAADHAVQGSVSGPDPSASADGGPTRKSRRLDKLASLASPAQTHAAQHPMNHNAQEK